MSLQARASFAERTFVVSDSLQLRVTKTPSTVVLRHARRTRTGWVLDPRAVVISQSIAREVALLVELAAE